MNSFQVPAPPPASFEQQKSNAAQKLNRLATAPQKKFAPLDAEFLQRVYRTNLLFGALLSLGLGLILHSMAALLSGAAGVLSALLVLKAKELFVLRVVRPLDAAPYEGTGKWLPRWAIGIGKFFLIGGGIALLHRYELINFVAFVIGVASVQVMIISMALGRLLGNRDAGRSLRDIYVTPHKIKNTPHV